MKRNPYKWEKSEAAKYAEKYWTEHGYIFTFVRNNQYKDDYIVDKNGIFMGYSVLANVVDFHAEMIKFEEKFKLNINIWHITHPKW